LRAATPHPGHARTPRNYSRRALQVLPARSHAGRRLSVHCRPKASPRPPPQGGEAVGADGPSGGSGPCDGRAFRDLPDGRGQHPSNAIEGEGSRNSAGSSRGEKSDEGRRRGHRVDARMKAGRRAGAGRQGAGILRPYWSGCRSRRSDGAGSPTAEGESGGGIPGEGGSGAEETDGEARRRPWRSTERANPRTNLERRGFQTVTPSTSKPGGTVRATASRIGFLG